VRTYAVVRIAILAQTDMQVDRIVRPELPRCRAHRLCRLLNRRAIRRSELALFAVAKVAAAESEARS
jgi:hypothetical protein